MRLAISLLLCVLVIAPDVNALVINEMMPNPDDDCWDCSEWLEIASEDNRSLEGITLDTGEGPIVLNGTIGEGEFLVITKNLNEFSRIWNSSAAILECSGMSLRNSGDNVTIYNNSEILHRIVYNLSDSNVSYGLCGEGFIAQNISTPGARNICMKEEENETNTTNATETDRDCDISVSITSEQVFASGETHSYLIGLIEEDCGHEERQAEIEYMIIDMFGVFVKSPYTTIKNFTCGKNISRQWTPPDIRGSEAFYLIAGIKNSSCSDSDSSNDFAEKLVVVRGKEPEADNQDCEPVACEPCSCAPCPPCSKEENEREEFEILSCPPEILTNSEFEILARIRNDMTHEKEYRVYSYLYDSKRLLSLGFDGNGWVKEWNANEQNVSVPGDSSVLVTLKNMVDEDTEPGRYSLRVRVWREGKKHDITETIEVKENDRNPDEGEDQKEAEESWQAGAEEDETGKEGPTETAIPTGRLVSKRNVSWWDELINKVIDFFKNLFNL